MTGLAWLMLIFALLIFLAGSYLYTGRKGDFTELLLWKNPQANKMTKAEIKNVGKWTMISSLVPLLVVIISLCVTSCSREDDFNVNLKTDTYMSICEVKSNENGIKNSTISTTNYNENKYAINMKEKSVTKYEKKEDFKFYLKEAKRNVKVYRKEKNASFKYTVDEKNQIIRTLLIYKKIELTEDNKESYAQDAIIKKTLAKNGICKSIDMTRK